MTQSPLALVAELRGEHQPFTTQRGTTFCRLDLRCWPCPVMQATTALEQSEAGAAILREAIEYSVERARDMSDDYKDRYMNALHDPAGAAFLERLRDVEAERDRWREEARLMTTNRDYWREVSAPPEAVGHE